MPTCSAPVRRVTARRQPARLACIRHAASVDPEPGSNSPPRCVPCRDDSVTGFVERVVSAPRRRGACSVFGAPNRSGSRPELRLAPACQRAHPWSRGPKDPAHRGAGMIPHRQPPLQGEAGPAVRVPVAEGKPSHREPRNDSESPPSCQGRLASPVRCQVLRPRRGRALVREPGKYSGRSITCQVIRSRFPAAPRPLRAVRGALSSEGSGSIAAGR